MTCSAKQHHQWCIECQVRDNQNKTVKYRREQSHHHRLPIQLTETIKHHHQLRSTNRLTSHLSFSETAMTSSPNALCQPEISTIQRLHQQTNIIENQKPKTKTQNKKYQGKEKRKGPIHLAIDSRRKTKKGKKTQG